MHIFQLCDRARTLYETHDCGMAIYNNNLAL